MGNVMGNREVERPGRRAATRLAAKKKEATTLGVVEYPGAALVEIMLTCRQLASRQRRIGRVRACVAKARDARALGRSSGSVAFRAPRSPRASFAAACRGPPRPFRRSPSRPTPPRNRIRPDRDGRLRPRLLSSARAFRAPSGPRRAARRSRATLAPTRAAARSEFADFFPDEVTALEEPAAVEMARRCEQISVADVPGRDAPIMTSCVGAPAPPGGESNAPFVLLHGFDSSCLEYRRLFPLLSERAETWALDLLGWGFTDAGDAGIGDYSPRRNAPTSTPSGNRRSAGPSPSWVLPWAARRRSISPPRIPNAWSASSSWTRRGSSRDSGPWA